MKERRKEEEINRSQGRRPLLHFAQLVFPIDRGFSEGKGGALLGGSCFESSLLVVKLPAEPG